MARISPTPPAAPTGMMNARSGEASGVVMGGGAAVSPTCDTPKRMSECDPEKLTQSSHPGGPVKGDFAFSFAGSGPSRSTDPWQASTLRRDPGSPMARSYRVPLGWSFYLPGEEYTPVC